MLFILAVKTASADVVVGASADLKVIENTASIDLREKYLREFFEKYNSPLTEHSVEFIEAADRYALDWRLVPAITGVESTFGKRIPTGSYNAYGWANGKYHFESWEDSIKVVSKTLRENYYDNGTKNIDQISRRYAPPSDSWSWKVKYFMNMIDPIPVDFNI